LFRAEARTRWRSVLILALLLGLAGGTALAAAAGARRTASAYPRYLRAAHASDVTIDLPSGFEGRADELAGALPGVVAHSISIGMAALLAGPDGSPDLAGADQVVSSVDGRFITSDGPALVSGRLPKLDRADEALVNQTMARRRRIAPGDRITLLRASAADVQAADGGVPASTSPLVLRVTGIVVNNTEVVQDDVSRLNIITLTPAYYAQHQHDALFPRLGLRLRDGHRGVPAVQAAVQRLLPNQPDDPDSGVSVEDTGAIVSRTQQAIKPLLEALVLFAALAGMIGLLVIGQALSRDILLAAADNPTRNAMGADRKQLFLLSLLSGAVVAVAGALVAVWVAVALSPLFPLDPVRVAEPDRGVSVDAAALGAGAILIVVLVIARAALSAWVASWAPTREKSARAARRTDRAIDSLPPSVAVGVRFAVDLRRGSAALPLRASVAGSVAARLAALLALVSFAGNLDHLQRTPAQYGWDWDLGFLSNSGYGAYAPEELRPLDDDAAVAGYSAISFAEVAVDGVTTSALGFATTKQPVLPPVVAGRTFSAVADEVMLGSTTLRRLRKSVGDDVTIALGGTAIRARVVGRTVLPAFGRVDTRRAGRRRSRHVCGDVHKRRSGLPPRCRRRALHLPRAARRGSATAQRPRGPSEVRTLLWTPAAG